MAAVFNLFQTVGQFMPLWLMVPIGVGLVLVLVPNWLHGVRVKQVRERVRRMVRAPAGVRATLLDEARDIARADPELWSNLARELRRHTFAEMYRQVLEEMSAKPALAPAAARIRNETERDRSTQTMRAGATAVLIEELIQDGRWADAQSRLTSALAEHPDDALLLGLAERVAAAAPAPADP